MAKTPEKAARQRSRYLNQRIKILRAEIKDLKAQAVELRAKRGRKNLSRKEKVEVGRSAVYVPERLREARGEYGLKKVERSGLVKSIKSGA